MEIHRMARQHAQKINEDVILEMLRLEYDRRLERATGSENTDPQMVVSPGLVLKHRRTGIEYSVITVDGRSAVLRSPEGDEEQVDMRSITNDYLID